MPKNKFIDLFGLAVFKSKITDLIVNHTADNSIHVSPASHDHANQVWKTDDEGNPGWRDEKNTEIQNQIDEITGNINILNENYKQLTETSSPKSAAMGGMTNVTAGVGAELVRFNLPGNGNFYIVTGQVRSQTFTGACVSLQITGGLVSTDQYPGSGAGDSQNYNSTIIARSGSLITLRCWPITTGQLRWEYAYVQVS